RRELPDPGRPRLRAQRLVRRRRRRRGRGGGALRGAGHRAPPCAPAAAREPARRSRGRVGVSGAVAAAPAPRQDAAMQSRPLFAPWRMDYIKSVVKGEDDDKCYLCQAAAARTDEERRQRLTLWTTGTTAVVINRYPYTNGHLLIFPIAHKADLEELTQEEQLDLQRQTADAVRLLKRAMSPQGFNI